MKKNILISLAILAFGIGMFLLGNYIAATNYKIVATTDNPQKANEIQEALTRFGRPTIRYVDGSRNMIAIFGTNKNNVDYAAVELAEANLITDDVGINPNVDVYMYITSTKPKKIQKLENMLNRAFSKRLSHVDGIYSAKTNIHIPEATFFINESDPTTADVTINTNKAFDLERISNTTKTLLEASVPGLSKENIKINFEYEECDTDCLARTYYGQAKRAIFMDKDYDKALKNLEKADELKPQTYSNSINSIKKLIELNKKIAQNPKNYKLYIERGDLKNIDEISMFASNSSITSDYDLAIEDYKKALELNPKAYEVYEKLGDAYSNTGWRRCDTCKLERDIYDEQHAIDYYEKSIKYLGGNDLIYKKLGDRYMAAKDKKKANEYYAKIKNPQSVENLNPSVPKPDKSWFKPLKRL